MSFKSAWKKAFKVNVEEDYAFTDEEIHLLKNLAEATKKRGLTTPTILFLESFKPMNFIGSQLMVFFKPILSLFADTTTYEKYSEILCRRGSIDKLLEVLEEQESGDSTRNPEEKKNSDS